MWLSTASKTGYSGVGMKAKDSRNKKPQDQLLKQFRSQNNKDSKEYHDTLDDALVRYATKRAVALSHSTVPHQLHAHSYRKAQKHRVPDTDVVPDTAENNTDLPLGWSVDSRTSGSGKAYKMYKGPDGASSHSRKQAWAVAEPSRASSTPHVPQQVIAPATVFASPLDSPIAGTPTVHPVRRLYSTKERSAFVAMWSTLLRAAVATYQPAQPSVYAPVQQGPRQLSRRPQQ